MRTMIALTLMAAPAMAKDTECAASAAAFSAIEIGMTAEQAIEAVGCAPFEYQSEYDESGSIRHVKWTGNGNPITSELGLFIRDGIVTRKSQTDLR